MTPAEALGGFALEPLKYGANKVNANARTSILKVREPEGPSLAGNGSLDDRGLLAARAFYFPESFSKFSTGLLQLGRHD